MPLLTVLSSFHLLNKYFLPVWRGENHQYSLCFCLSIYKMRKIMTITLPLGCCDYNLTTVSGSESPLKVMLVCIIDTSHCTILPSEQKPSETFCMWGSFCLSLFFFSQISPCHLLYLHSGLCSDSTSKGSLLFSPWKIIPCHFLSSLSCFIFLHGTDCLLSLGHGLLLLFFLSHYCFTTYRQGLYLFISVHSQQRKELDAWHVLNKY